MQKKIIFMVMVGDIDNTVSSIKVVIIKTAVTKCDPRLDEVDVATPRTGQCSSLPCSVLWTRKLFTIERKL